MRKQFVRIALCQRGNLPTKAENLAASLAMAERAVQGCADLDLLVFPECNDIFAASWPQAAANAEPVPGPFTEAFADFARRHQVNVIPGSVLESQADGRVKNTVPFLNRSGELAARYEKIHLMDAMQFKESAHVAAGNEICVFDADFGRVGILVCYDLRFPELARSMALAGAEILICPACFPVGTPLPPRTDHWDVLVDAMALQNLTWVCACNQFGAVAGAQPFGRSRVTDPWGTAVAVAGGREEILYATLDLGYLDEVRQRLATWQNRRPDLYRL